MTFPRRTLLAAVLMAFASACANTPLAQDELPAKLADAIAKCTESINSYDVYSTIETANLMKTVKVGDAASPAGREAPEFELKPLPKGATPSIRTLFTHQARSANGKERVEVLTHTSGEVTTLHTFDGVTRKTFQQKGNLGITGGKSPDEKQFLNGLENYRTLFQTLSSGGSLRSLLLDRAGLIRLVDGDNADGTITMEIPEKAGSNFYPEFSWQFTFDPNHAMLPCKWTERIKGRTSREVSIDEFHQISTDKWAPIAATETSFAHIAGKAEPLTRTRVAIDPHRSRWNAELPDEMFDVPFPDGARIFDEDANAYTISREQLTAPLRHSQFDRAAIERMFSTARLQHKNILLVIGSVESDSTFWLLKALHDDESLRAIAPEFFRVTIDAKSFAANEQPSLQPLCDEVNSQGPTVLAVLDEQGKILDSLNGKQLESNGAIDTTAVRMLLENSTIGRIDAAATFAAALDQAKHERKKVLLQESGGSCYPCQLFSEYFERRKSILDKDYIYLVIDRERQLHGDDVMKRVRTNGEHSIPWLAILDADGKVLNTSDAKDGNIGFPTTANAVRHFADMLNATRQNISEVDIQTISGDLDRSVK